MASTNKTTNYQLSQYSATDKPSYLGDYNQDMSKIDAGMKANADNIATNTTAIAGHTTAIAGLTSDVASAQADITTLDGRVDTLEAGEATQNTAIQNAQNDATTAINASATNTQSIAQQALDITSLQNDVQTNAGAINTTQGNVDSVNNALSALKTSLTLSKFTNQNSITGLDTNIVNLTLAQSEDSATFKFYGTLSVAHGSGSYTYAKTAITGLSGYYGVKTTLKLDVAPTEAFLINGAGLCFAFVPGQEGNNGLSYGARQTEAIAVDSEGYLYCDVNTNSTRTIGSSERFVFDYFACLYFNTNFGDEPTPQN